MAANKGEKELNKLFDEIIVDISENGKSAISALKGRMSTQTFYVLLEDSERSKRYARATEMRAERMADEVLEIADNENNDELIKDDNIKVQRDRIRVDSRKWILAKLHPKKYGDKIDMTSGDKPIQTSLNILVDNSSTAETLKKLRDGSKTN
jgi:hypothetical protein